MSIFTFAEGVTFNAETGEVARPGARRRLEPQPAAILAQLAQRPGELLSQDQLRQAVWGDATHVQLKDSLHYCIRQIRAALGDSARAPRYIETIPRRGYRLRSEALLLDTGVITQAPRTPTRPISRWALRAAALALLVVGLLAIEQRPNSHHELAVATLRTLHDLVY
jgi:DNA-binding winged helix-turn-helix (wHTH) protein